MLNDEERTVHAPAERLDSESPSAIQLPAVPAEQRNAAVACWVEPLVIDSYLPDEPEDFPSFLEQRVYQGSSGRVYPLPFHERISQTREPHRWNAVHLENEWLRVVVLPELGGRVHIAYDKVADYDFVYRNNVVKPALVGLAGPWISGGIEFNWPQHHRPATFLPVDVEIEREDDGAVTVWCSDHDPFTRMKGMHGIRLAPDSSVLEARVRLYNRSDETQTFLWWANVAAASNDDYQSFFPTDVHEVADHARRAVASFPAVDGRYYGVDYPAQVSSARPDGDRLDWYRNIPVPTSYMVLSSDDDFFGGYDHGRDAGFVHWADHHEVPGKKQWTWGNAPFGWAWDRNLTDGDGPYVELMAGAFTNNQPDFSFLAPGETKTFSQCWYPVHETGVVHQASRECAIRFELRHDDPTSTELRLRCAVTTSHSSVTITIRTVSGEILAVSEGPHSPRAPRELSASVARHLDADEVVVEVAAGDIRLLRWSPRATGEQTSALDAATEPPQPEAVASTDELFLIGQYLEQYRHATRLPEPYWLEALRRDPGDARCNTALGVRAARAADLGAAERFLRTAIERQTSRVPNPSEGEAHYQLGLVLVRQERDDEARRYFAKALWNAAWRVPAGLALARLEGRAGDFDAAISELRRVLLLDAEHLQARDLLASLLRRQEHPVDELVAATLALDPLDQWARDLAGLPLSTDAGTLLDVALEYASSGLLDEALRLLGLAAEAARTTAQGQVQVAPLVHFHRAAISDRLGDRAAAADARRLAQLSDHRHCQASRVDDLQVLLLAVAADPGCGLAELLIGNWYYDKRRYDDAIEHWRRAASCELPPHLAAVTQRNLGIAAFNVAHDVEAAREHYVRAVAAQPDNAKLLYEADQLDERAGETVGHRIDRLTPRIRLVAERDDLTVVYANLLTAANRADEARALLAGRQFQPWEGGEGLVLDAWDRATCALAEAALELGEPQAALALVDSALSTPESLGEARHPLANAAKLFLLRGDILQRCGRADEALSAWERAAGFAGDFLQMSTRPFSTQSYYSIVALLRLDRLDEATAKTQQLASWSDELSRTPATVDYFATSLPSMLLFHTDPQLERDLEVATIRSQLDMLGSTLPITTAP